MNGSVLLGTVYSFKSIAKIINILCNTKEFRKINESFFDGGHRSLGMHPEKYGVKHFIKFGDYNIGRDGDLLTLPTYMQFLLDLEPEEVVLEAIDTDELTRMAREFLDQKS